MDVFSNVVDAALAQSGLEWLAVVASLIYVVLAAKENIWCWFFGIIGVVCYLVVFYQSKFFLDALLQVYYFVMSIIGWMMWRKNESLKTELMVSTRGLSFHLLVIGAALFLSYPLGLLSQYFGGALPFIDALTTTFSLLATWLVAKKILENWLYWIVIDLVCVMAYWSKELYLTAMLFALYSIIAVFGFYEWRKKSPSIA